MTVQKTAEELATELKETHKIDARAYHAGMTSDKRKEVQDWFIRGSGVVVATIAWAGIPLAHSPTERSHSRLLQFWHGHRQGQHSRRRPLLDAQDARELLVRAAISRSALFPPY